MYSLLFFFFNDTATTEIYTLSLHDALPILDGLLLHLQDAEIGQRAYLITGDPTSLTTYQGALGALVQDTAQLSGLRSEEHTSELQSRQYLVCRLLLEKKKT